MVGRASAGGTVGRAEARPTRLLSAIHTCATISSIPRSRRYRFHVEDPLLVALPASATLKQPQSMALPRPRLMPDGGDEDHQHRAE